MMPFNYVCHTGHIAFGIFLKFDRYIDVVEVLPPYCFGNLRVKSESNMSQTRLNIFKNKMHLVCVRPTGHISCGIFL